MAGPATQGEAMETAILAEQVRTLFRQSAWILIVNPLNAAIVAAVLWSTPRAGLLLGWVAAMAVVGLYRAGLRARYLRALPPEAEAARWARRYVLGAAASGILWGLGGALLYDP